MQTPEQSSMMKKLQVPLVVGVTGHKDIMDPEDVKKKLELFWKTVKQLAGPDTEIILLSSIARGADHLVITSCRGHNIRYCVVLPFEKEKFKEECRKELTGQALTDFEKEFNEDFDGKYKVITCDAQTGDYTVASDYVRKHCDILLTLWDGYETLEDNQDNQGKNGADRKPAKGGTYYQIHTVFGLDDLLQHHQEKRHLIVNIAVKRSEKSPEHKKKNEKQICMQTSGLSVLELEYDNEKRIITPSKDFETWAKDFLERDDVKNIESFSASEKIEDFADAVKFIRYHNHKAKTPEWPRKDGEYYLRQKFCLNEEKKPFEAGKTALSIVQDDFDRHDYYDNFAGIHQNPHKKQFRRIAGLSVIVGIFGLLWGGCRFYPDDVAGTNELIMHCVIVLYLTGCILLFLYDRKISRDNHYSLYLQPRIIAELLRLKIFWKLAGIPGSFSDHILDENSEHGFAILLCNWEIAEPEMLEENRRWIEAGNGMEVVNHCWLEDQSEYYDSNILCEQVYEKLTKLEEDNDNLRSRKVKMFSFAWFQKFFHKTKNYFKKYYYLLFYVPEVKNTSNPAEDRNDGKESKPAAEAKFCFEKYIRKCERREGYALLFKDLFFILGFVLAFFLIVVYIYAVRKGLDPKKKFYLDYYREFMVGVCPFLVASLGWLREKNKWGAIAHQYKEMRNLFRKTVKHINDPKFPKEAKRQIIQELIMFAHKENAEWNCIKKDSNPEPMW